MSVTIQDVAAAAGVSKATVSKVLSDSYSISQETKDRVRAVIQELGYSPNRRAQSFATTIESIPPLKPTTTFSKPL